jgi:outer membrane protein TolC
MKRVIVFFIIAGLGLVTVVNIFGQDTFTLDKYLIQVQEKNSELKSAGLAAESMSNKILELDMVYSPFVIGNYTWIDDKSGPGYGATLSIKEMVTNTWTVGLNKKFKTGSAVSFGYTNAESDLNLSSPYNFGPFSLSRFTGYEIKTYAKIEQSLLRDYKSRLTDAGIDKAKSLVKAGQYMQTMRVQQTLLKSRMTYLTLALCREIIMFRKEELDRAEKILKWNDNRVNLDLADKGDLLQAQALYRLRKLNLQMAVEDEKNACRDFNELRGMAGDTVAENINSMFDTVAFCAEVSSLSYTGQRADLLAARESFNSSEFAKTETLYRSYPEISAFGSVSLHGLDLSASNANNQITQTDKPTYMVGLNLIVPLDIGTLKQVRHGYDQDYLSSQETLLKTEAGIKKDWSKLVDTWDNVKSRLALAQEIKKIQTDRLANEQLKFERGRTTMFQLLSAENDLDDATINVYRLMFEQFVTYAQVELYNTK